MLLLVLVLVGGASSAQSNTGGGHPTKDYSDALAKSILFFDAQRSGKLPADNPIPWRGDSALDDCVVGGWYDAGDHVKFGLPFGSSVHLLMWSLVKYKDGYVKAGQLDMMYDMIKWATDYMLAAWNPSRQELVVQIGVGNVDHTFWGRPEDMTMDRACYKVGRHGTCSDIAGEWAASMAAGYMAFKDKDAHYANRLLGAAKSLYAFGRAHPGMYSDSIPTGRDSYGSDDYHDEMCLGAVWLHRATGQHDYLAQAKSYHKTGTPWGLGWGDKMSACQLLLYEDTSDDRYLVEVESYMHSWLPGGNVPYTPCGLAFRNEWGSIRWAANTAFFALAAADAGVKAAEYRKWAIEQINYMLGDNPHDGGCFSYEIGYGTKYPLRPHHRAASCPDPPTSCTSHYVGTSDPSPHVLLGGLVGGPDQQDNYADVRTDYVKNEVALDYNAGFQGALAAVNHLLVTGNFPPTHNKCPCST